MVAVASGGDVGGGAIACYFGCFRGACATLAGVGDGDGVHGVLLLPLLVGCGGGAGGGDGAEPIAGLRDGWRAA